MLLHASHAAKAGHHSVIIVSDDTDVLVLSLSVSDALPCSLILKTGTKSRINYVNISQLVGSLGSNLCKALPGLHAYTGCDTVSAFAGRGKLSALNLLQKNNDFCETFQKLGAEWTVTSDLYEALQAFTCEMYSRKTKITKVNQMRHALFCAKRPHHHGSYHPAATH